MPEQYDHLVQQISLFSKAAFEDIDFNEIPLSRDQYEDVNAGVESGSERRVWGDDEHAGSHVDITEQYLATTTKAGEIIGKHYLEVEWDNSELFTLDLDEGGLSSEYENVFTDEDATEIANRILRALQAVSARKVDEKTQENYFFEFDSELERFVDEISTELSDEKVDEIVRQKETEISDTEPEIDVLDQSGENIYNDPLIEKIAKIQLSGQEYSPETFEHMVEHLCDKYQLDEAGIEAVIDEKMLDLMHIGAGQGISDPTSED